MRYFNRARYFNFLSVFSIILILLISSSAVSAVDDSDIFSSNDHINSNIDDVSLDEKGSDTDLSIIDLDDSEEEMVLSDDVSVENDGFGPLSDAEKNKYVENIRSSNSDLYNRFFNHLINDCSFEFRNDSFVGDGYKLYATQAYEGTYFDGVKFTIQPNQFYFVSTNERDSYIIKNTYFEDIVYSHNDNYYLDEEYLGWILENSNFTINNTSSGTIGEINVPQSSMKHAPSNINLPSHYDLREEGFVTPVKDQGNTNNCWIFASMGALESYLLKFENVSYNFTADLDLSENHLNKIMSSSNMHGYDREINGTGDFLVSLAYFLRWGGPVNEIDDPYGSPINSSNLSPVKHVQGVKFIKPRNNSLDLNEIKKAIYNYGGLVTGLYWNSSCLNNFSYIFTGNISNLSNSIWHAVTVVGWDDNYPASKFNTSENISNGAFIIKNSYGASNGEKGYHYVSYYDHSLAYGRGEGFVGFVFTDVADVNNFASNYNYNPLGLNSWLSYGAGEVAYANQWVCEKNEYLKACGLYVIGPSKCCIRVKVNDNYVGGDTNCSFDQAGFYTINFNHAIPVNKGQKFRVEVIMQNNGVDDTLIIPIEQKYDKYSKVSSESNQSFLGTIIGKNNIIWKDLTTFLVNNNDTLADANICLHVFTDMVSGSVNTRVVSNDLDMFYGDGYLNATLVDGVGLPLANKNVVFRYYSPSGNINDYTYVTDSYGRAKKSIGLSPGTYKFDINFYGDSVYNSSTRTVKVVVNKMPTSLTTVGSCYHGDYFTATLKDKNGKPLSNCSVSITISDKTYYKTTDGGGKIGLQINLKNNTYKVTVKFGGTKNYLGVSKTVDLKVYRAPAKLIVSNYTGSFNSTKPITVKLLNTKTNKGISGKIVSFKVDTGASIKTYNRTTDDDGVASFDPSRLSVGNHNVIISSSNANVVAASVNINAKITKANTIVSAPSVTYKVNTQNYLKVTVKHKDNNNLLAGLKLTIKAYTGANYNTYTIITKDNGVATFNTKVLGVGTHKIVISSANNNYDVTANSTVKITN